MKIKKVVLRVQVPIHSFHRLPARKEAVAPSRSGKKNAPRRSPPQPLWRRCGAETARAPKSRAAFPRNASYIGPVSWAEDVYREFWERCCYDMREPPRRWPPFRNVLWPFFFFARKTPKTGHPRGSSRISCSGSSAKSPYIHPRPRRPDLSNWRSAWTLRRGGLTQFQHHSAAMTCWKG